MHDLKTPTNDERASEQALDLFWRGIGRDIKVFGFESQHHIAYRTADDEGFEARALQGFCHPYCIG